MTRPALRSTPHPSFPVPHGRIGRSAVGVLLASAVMICLALLVFEIAAVLAAATLAPIFLR